MLIEADNAAVGDDCGHQLGGSDVEDRGGRGRTVGGGGHPGHRHDIGGAPVLDLDTAAVGVAASTVDSGAPTMKGIRS